MSVLTLVSKIIGRTIQVQFLAFFNRTRPPVSLTDSGFRTKPHSTETAVVYLTDYNYFGTYGEANDYRSCVYWLEKSFRLSLP